MKRKLRITRRGFIRLSIWGILAIAGGKGFLNSRNLGLVNEKVYLKRLPPAFDGVKIGQITDIHAGPLVPSELIKKGVHLIMKSSPT